MGLREITVKRNCGEPLMEIVQSLLASSRIKFIGGSIHTQQLIFRHDWDLQSIKSKKINEFVANKSSTIKLFLGKSFSNWKNINKLRTTSSSKTLRGPGGIGSTVSCQTLGGLVSQKVVCNSTSRSLWVIVFLSDSLDNSVHGAVDASTETPFGCQTNNKMMIFWFCFTREIGIRFHLHQKVIKTDKTRFVLCECFLSFLQASSGNKFHGLGDLLDGSNRTNTSFHLLQSGHVTSLVSIQRELPTRKSRWVGRDGSITVCKRSAQTSGVEQSH
mmetsp:Transcript_14989/g.20961  ORF Transcript_14989/g.20961 Transcript_14989/m.20961 type:complete len:273 (+) Transcript_14989:246-1064(+)